MQSLKCLVIIYETRVLSTSLGDIREQKPQASCLLVEGTDNHQRWTSEGDRALDGNRLMPEAWWGVGGTHRGPPQAGRTGGHFPDRGQGEEVFLVKGSRAKALRWSLPGLLRWIWQQRSPGVADEGTVRETP